MASDRSVGKWEQEKRVRDAVRAEKFLVVNRLTDVHGGSPVQRTLQTDILVDVIRGKTKSGADLKPAGVLAVTCRQQK